MDPLWLFALFVFGIIVVPGMDMAYVLSSSLVDGRRAGRQRRAAEELRMPLVDHALAHLRGQERDAGLLDELAQHPSGDLGKPVIDTGEHSEYGGTSHNQVKVRYNKISIVKVNIQRGVTQEDTSQTSRNKERYHTDSEQHRWRKTDVTTPQCCQVVERLHRRRNRNDQRRNHKHTAQ